MRLWQPSANSTDSILRESHAAASADPKDVAVHEALFELGEQAAGFDGSGDDEADGSSGSGVQVTSQALCPLGHFLSYCDYQQDDDPLYIFDGTFDQLTPQLAEQYRVPRWIQPSDPLACLEGHAGARPEGSSRPPFKWWLVGPARSGTLPHKDPLHTSAWNALVAGVKHWVFFPPDTPESIVMGGMHTEHDSSCAPP